MLPFRAAADATGASGWAKVFEKRLAPTCSRYSTGSVILTLRAQMLVACNPRCLEKRGKDFRKSLPKENGGSHGNCKSYFQRSSWNPRKTLASMTLQPVTSKVEEKNTNEIHSSLLHE